MQLQVHRQDTEGSGDAVSNQRDKLNDRENILTIIQSCEKILSYTEGMDWEDFIHKSYIVDACAMNCLVIG